MLQLLKVVKQAVDCHSLQKRLNCLFSSADQRLSSIFRGVPQEYKTDFIIARLYCHLSKLKSNNLPDANVAKMAIKTIMLHINSQRVFDEGLLDLLTSQARLLPLFAELKIMAPHFMPSLRGNTAVLNRPA